MSEIETSAWDGRPQNPEADGWHWLRWTPYADYEPFPCEWRNGEWLADDDWPVNTRPHQFAYLGPCLTPAERDALAARLEKAEGMAEALEVGLSALPTDMTGGPRHRARTALAAWRAASGGRDGDR